MKKSLPLKVEKLSPTNKIELEPIDLCLKLNIITKEELKLGLHLLWLFRVNYGMPTVQAYNPSKIQGLSKNKYSDKELHKIREEYKFLIDYLYKENRESAKLLVNLVVYRYKPKVLYAKIVAKLSRKTLDKRYIK